MRPRKFAATVATVSILVLSVSSVGTALAASGSPHTFSANMALTSNYMFRGVSQTNNGPAIQGGFDYEHNPSDLYAGVWASNVDSSAQGYNGASMELDIYAGWAPSWKNTDLDLGYMRYQYPRTKTDNNNTDEFYLGLSHTILGAFTPSYTAHYSDDFFGRDSAWYHDLSIEIPLIPGYTLAGHYGWNRFHDRSTNYEDYKIGIVKEYSGFEFDLSWVDHSDEATCSPPFQCGETTVFTLSKSF